MVNTLKYAGAASATWYHVPNIDPETSQPDPADDYLSASDWALLPDNSRLKAVLNRPYANIASFVSAWAAEGGEVDRVQFSGGGPGQQAPVWFLDGNGYPKLYCFYSYEPVFSYARTRGIIRLALSYSASA